MSDSSGINLPIARRNAANGESPGWSGAQPRGATHKWPPPQRGGRNAGWFFAPPAFRRSVRPVGARRAVGFAPPGLHPGLSPLAPMGPAHLRVFLIPEGPGHEIRPLPTDLKAYVVSALRLFIPPGTSNSRLAIPTSWPRRLPLRHNLGPTIQHLQFGNPTFLRPPVYAPQRLPASTHRA